jgi:hypothetical protein
MNNDLKKKILKGILKKGVEKSSFAEASSPINLLKLKGAPPTAQKIPKSVNNK